MLTGLLGKQSGIAAGLNDVGSEAVVWPTSDAELQTLTGYASAADSMWVFGTTFADSSEPDLIGSNTLTLAGTGMSDGTDSSFSNGTIDWADNSTGTLTAGNVFSGEADVAIMLIFKCSAPGGATRTICGKADGGTPTNQYYELRLDNSNRLRLRCYDATTIISVDATSANFTNSTLTYCLMKIDRTVANTAVVWTNHADSAETDISTITGSIDSTANFGAIDGRNNNPPIKLGFMAVWTGAAARGITKTALTNMETNQALPA